jgi:DDE superfamily endonuclease
MDTSFYSHKLHQPGVNYEIGLSIFQNKCVWVNGPFPASKHDVTVYKMPNGLQDKIPNGKKVIGDEGYRGSNVSTSNPEDTAAVKKFKSRAKLRHETFNAKIKTFRSVSERFNRSLNRHQSVFEAVCVIVQYQLENGSTLYEV